MDDLREAFSAIQNKLNDLFNRVNQLEATPVITSGSGGGAPVDAQYLTLAFNAILTQERRLDFSASFATVDGGAGADFDVDLSNTGVGAGAYGSATQVGTFTVDAQGRLTNAANVAIAGVPPAAHPVLSTYHSDAATDAVTRGSLIIGNSTPQWDELNFPGAANYVLTTNATDVIWSTNTLSIAGNSTINGSLVGNMTGSGTIATGGFTGTLPKTGTLPVGTGIVGRIAEWVTDINTLQASTLIKSGAGVLTLSAGGAYTLTIPATGTTVLGTGTNTYVTYWNGTNTVTGDAGFTYVVATNSLTAGDYYTTDGGNFGISGNELLTVNAAGTFAFSGISGVTVQDGDYFGIASDVRIAFDSTNGYIEAILGDAAGADEFQIVDSGGAAVATIDSDGNVVLANITMTATDAQITSNTADASDSKRLRICGGGAPGPTRGAYMNVYGNEYAGTDGDFEFIAGNPGISGRGRIKFYTGATVQAMAITEGQTLLLGTTTAPTGNLKCMIFGDNAGDPTPGANTAGIFAKDVAGTVEMFGVDEAGNVNQLTSHPTSNLPFDALPWEYILNSSNTYIGKQRYIRIEQAIRKLEELTGEQFIFDVAIPKVDWYLNQAAQNSRKPKPQWMKEFN